MRLILLGPPGVGKGTQAIRLKQFFDIIHLSTGEILRNEVASKSEIGKEAKTFMDEGKLVPDSVLLKGFPRTIPQAEGLDKILKKLNHQLSAVISLTADKDELLNRLVLRGKESGRSDDTPEVIEKRQIIYWAQTAPLLRYYSKSNIVHDVNGMGAIADITDRITKNFA